MEGKVVLVTGGSSGIGLSICKYLLTKGCKVFGTSRKVKNGDIQNDITMVRMDVSDRESIKNAVDYVVQSTNRLDVLVNNAGLGMAGSIEDSSTEEIEEIFKTNVFGLLDCCRAVIPQMRKQHSGQIINISSIAGEFGLPFRGVYSASKSAVDRFSETLRMELAQWNIHVSIMQPGDFKTNINQTRRVAAKGLSDESQYREVFRKEYKVISEDVTKAKDPILVAQRVWKVISEKNPKMRYPVATPLQRFALSVNRVLPTHLFQKMLNWIYPVK
ncbi:MAG: SDR family oxidoreductase [Cryomorphaceae bacterium]